jgi:hypothetical protein
MYCGLATFCGTGFNFCCGRGGGGISRERGGEGVDWIASLWNTDSVGCGEETDVECGEDVAASFAAAAGWSFDASAPMVALPGETEKEENDRRRQ